MNIEASTIQRTTLTGEVQQNQASSNQQTSSKGDTQSFKDALKSVSSNDKTATEQNSTNAQTKTQASSEQNNETQSTQTANAQAQADSIKAQETAKNDQKIKNDLKELNDKKTDGKESIDDALLQPLIELKSKIETLSDLKNRGTFGTSKSSKTKSSELDADSKDMKTLKMDKNDALFFANLVKNENFAIQNHQQQGDNSSTQVLTSESTQASAQVSSTLMNALSDSMKTNKPFRIDFDKNIAVIMRVDKEGKLSAEFIPGDKAVETYLKNNIPMLKESFDNQNLSYGDLSYRRQQKDQQQENNKNNNKNKENENE